MIGSYHITISNSIVKYDFTIRRNITIIKGDSATGKTVLVEMIRDYVSTGSDSGITLVSNIACRVIDGNTWEDQLSSINNSIVFIDEGNSFVASDDFARKVKEGKNYYVIVTREKLSNLPYSVSEIYGIRSSGKYNSLEPVFHETYHIYEEPIINLPAGEIIQPELLITEDTNSGHDFFNIVTNNSKSIKECISAGGKSKVFSTAIDHETQNTLIIADGAAFGPEMEELCELIRSGWTIHLFLPESFEWLILNSGIISDFPQEQISHPEKYVNSAVFFSWEQYFTQLITQCTRLTPMKYSKDKLPQAYRSKVILSRILNTIKGIDFNQREE